MRKPDGAEGSTRLIHLSSRKKWVAGGVAALACLVRSWNRIRLPTPSKDAAILILEPFGLGDLISCEPLVRCLRKAGRHVVLCAKPEWRILFPESPGQTWLDTVPPWATHNEQAKYRFGSYFRPTWRDSLRKLKTAGHGAVGIDTRGDIRSVLLLHGVGCAQVLSLTRYLGSDLLVPAATAELAPFSLELRRWELNLEFLKLLGSTVDPATVSPPFFSHLAPAKRCETRSVSFMPVAPWRGKLWFTERWRQLAGELRLGGWELRVLCGPNQRALAKAQADVGAEIVECGSIQAWAAAFARSALIVTLDSGPMHLADALGVPVIALFGQGWLPLWAPSGPYSRVLAHRDDPDFAVCHPVDANAPLGQKYMERITVKEVLAAVEETWQALKQPTRITL